MASEIDVLTLDLSGSRAFEMNETTTSDVKTNASGGSVVTLVGSGDALNLEAVGSNVLNLGDFAVTDTMVESSGVSTISQRLLDGHTHR